MFQKIVRKSADRAAFYLCKGAFSLAKSPLLALTASQSQFTRKYDFKDTVFGQVVEGMDVVEKIANSPRSEENVPTEDILIESIVIS